MKSKKIGIIIGAVFVIVISPFVVQYGWNEIVTTIVPVGKITVEDYSYAVKSSISKIITCALLIWIASLFI
ncbi:membrane protein [Streptococcus phage MissD]|nr:membrane protein [Streptococcus phage MissD]